MRDKNGSATETQRTYTGVEDVGAGYYATYDISQNEQGQIGAREEKWSEAWRISSVKVASNSIEAFSPRASKSSPM
ncbi:hypothetical protein [Methylosinus sp. LW3]|uniref:hypothetical protein n=1 Tax=Methylosinus sp. LW3 TaxID=107635 RepID=UPI0004B9B1A7|nr:hypothetical protein [Methylosinus sp. LW3]